MCVFLHKAHEGVYAGTCVLWVCVMQGVFEEVECRSAETKRGGMALPLRNDSLL